MHSYLKEYFDHLWNRNQKADWMDRSKSYEYFIEHAYSYYSDQVLEYEVSKFPHIHKLYDIYYEKRCRGEGEVSVYQKCYFYGTYSVLKNYEDELEKLLRKEKIKQLLNVK